jgi:phenylalanine-4-hydroxylase
MQMRPRRVSDRADFVIDQDWAAYSADDHAVWDLLYERQRALLPGRAEASVLAGLDALDLGRGGVPKLDEISEELRALTGFTVVAVPSLVPDEVFFTHLANRRFPAGAFIRTRDELDYIEEPDIFHDVFGHVPLLTNPVFADYMQAYGEGGLRATGFSRLANLAALYWYTVEFGLVETQEGLRIYGAGILSSARESVFALDDPSPNRIGFDLERVMRTRYRIDDFQESYFVIRSYRELFDVTVGTDFAPLYQRLGDGVAHAPGALAPGDRILHRGTGAYAAMRRQAVTAG